MITVSPYGSMIALGLVVSGALARYLTGRFSLSFYDALILMVYTAAFGVAGAKLLYLLVCLPLLDGARLTDPAYLLALLRGGFVFLGGIPLGLAGLYLGGRMHHIQVRPYLCSCTPLLPLIHGFGRIGCCLTGCCYGIGYTGPLHIVYRSSLFAPNGVPLFPVQLVEAFLEFGVSLLLLRLVFRSRGTRNYLPLYLILYSALRFVLEFFRADSARGHWGAFSTSQWLCLLFLLLTLGHLIRLRLQVLRQRA